MSVKIRTATQSDLPVILQYIHDLAKYEKAPDEVELSLDDLKDSLFGPNPQVFCLISEQDNETTGFAVWHLNYSTWLGKHGIYLEDLYVDPKFRGQGHGKALLQKLAQICIENGYKRLQWWVLDWNESAIDFYKSIGAQPMDQWTVFRVSGSSLRKLATEGNQYGWQFKRQQICPMIKAFKRLFALLAGVLVIFGAIKSVFNWLARSENDEYEVWSDDEQREDAQVSSEYIAGACNIGKGEIRRRQFVALIGIFLTVSTATTLLATDQARSARFSIFLPAMIFSVGFIQSRKKFCLAYGLAGTFNFGKLGSITKVQSAEDRKADRKTAISILTQATFLAVAITAVFFALPL